MTYDHRMASRPIRLDKPAIKALVADELIPDIIRFLRQQKQDAPIGDKRQIAQKTLMVDPVGGVKPLPVTIIVGARFSNTNYAVVSGNAVLTDSWMDDLRVALMLYVNSAITPTEYLEKRLSSKALSRNYLHYGLYSVLIHELTHVMEMPFMRRTEYKLENGRPADPNEYVNAPSEVRAFMQQIVDEALIWAKRSLARMEAEGSNRRLVERVLQHSETWRLVRDSLASKNRNKILQAVYDALDKEGLFF